MVYNVRILILEDTASDADLIEFELQEAGIGFTSVRAKNENEYVRALKESSPDLILSDYDLPQYTGSLALAAAKKLRPEVPFILVTGAIPKDDDSLLREILDQGARDYVVKKHLERLAPAVRKVLGFHNGDGNRAAGTSGNLTPTVPRIRT